MRKWSPLPPPPSPGPLGRPGRRCGVGRARERAEGWRESPWCPGRASHLGCSPLQNGDKLRSPAGPRCCPGSKAARPSVGGAESRASRRASQQGRPCLPSRGLPCKALVFPVSVSPLLNGQPLPSWPHTAPSVIPLSPVPQGHSPRLCRLTKWASKASGESVNPGHPQPGPVQATTGTVPFHPRTEPLPGPCTQPRAAP